MRQGPFRVDLHAHYVGRDLIEAAKADPARYGLRIELDEAGGERVRFSDGSVVRPFFRELWDLDLRLVAMDAAGVAIQAISTWTDIFGDGILTETEAAWARLQNDSLAAAARHHPHRLIAMGVLPMLDTHAALEEIDYCAGVLGMRAVEIGTSIGGLSLDEPRFAPIWARLEKARFLIFLHPPRVTAAAPRLGRYFLNNLIGNPLEGVLAATALVFGGVLDRHPELQVCLPHAGGYFPYQVGRLDRGFAAKDECREHLRRPPSDYLGRFWYDTLTFRPDALRFLAELVGLDRLVFGTDYPFPLGDPTAASVVEAAFPRADLTGVWGETARALLGC
jgi:aminocarboxymuconate-semialdehyde decarboxylase